MKRKRMKLLKSLIAIVTAISINACCIVQAYALPEPSPDWWQAATVIVGGAAAKGTAVVSAPVVIGSVIVALGVCAGAWAVTHPDEFSEVVNGVKSRISSLLVGKDGSGMMVNVQDGVPYLDEESLTQIAQALDEGGYLSDGEDWSPNENASATGSITSVASVEEVFNYIISSDKYFFKNRWYDSSTLQHLYTKYPFLQNGNYLLFVYLDYYIYMLAVEKTVGDTVNFPVSDNGIVMFTEANNGYIRPAGYSSNPRSWYSFGLREDRLLEPGHYATYFSNANGIPGNDGYGKTGNAVQVDGDNVTMPDWIGDVKESIDNLGNTIKNYPIALPSGTTIPYIFPDTTPEADIKTMVQDVPIPDDKPIPDIAEEGRTQEEVQNPDPDKPIETLPEEPLTESTLPSLKLPAALAQRFPFSLVSDINVLISKLSGTGEAPHFSIPVKIDIANIDTSIDVDLSMFSGAVSVIRPVILACAVLGIIRLTFKVINV